MTFSVVSWQWSQKGYRSVFMPEHVHTLRSMVARHLHIPHRFVCITDTPRECFSSDIKVVPTPWNPQVEVRQGQPNCFRRLWQFGPDAKEVLGDRWLSIDLDCVIVDDITPLVDRPEDFVMWGDTARNTQYNGSMLLLKADSRPQVWQTFRGQRSYSEARAARVIGSDQGFISMTLGSNEAKWTEKDGVYSFRNNVAQRKPRTLPDNARIVFFHGTPDPWDAGVQEEYPWIAEHYH